MERGSRPGWKERYSERWQKIGGKEWSFVLRTGTEDLAASIATAGELGVVTIPAVDLVHLATELFVHQGHSAPVAQETGLVPMLILVRQILQTFVFTDGIILRFETIYGMRGRNGRKEGRGGERGFID